MGLQDACAKIFDTVLKVEEDEEVFLVTDGVEEEVVKALRMEMASRNVLPNFIEYEEPEHHGAEPPEKVREALINSDVFIAATNKSISHTEARNQATDKGARGASMPMITSEVLSTAADTDYKKMSEITEKIYSTLEESAKGRITTPLGTDLEFEIQPEHFTPENGLLQEKGDFGNIPSGEVFGPGINVRGVMMVDHLPMDPNAEGAELVIDNNQVVDVRNAEGTKLKRIIEEVDGSRNIAEIGIGTNPDAEIMNNLTNDEKILGTVHVALGDNQSFLPKGDDRRVESEIHWDVVLRNPELTLGDTKVLKSGVLNI